MKIHVLFPGPKHLGLSLRTVEDLLPYQDEGVELSIGYNEIGPQHCQTRIEEALAIAGMPQQAALAEERGVDAIVIESMGDTGLVECREAVNIPVVGMFDSAVRVATMLGHKFGMICAAAYHQYAFERLLKAYGLQSQFIGSEKLDMQPFFTDSESDEKLNQGIVAAIEHLISRGADTVVLGGSYFMGKVPVLQMQLTQKGFSDIVLIDPLPTAIRCARMLVDAQLCHSKKVYANPVHDTPVFGYPSMPRLPGVKAVLTTL